MTFAGEIQTCSNMAPWREHSTGVPGVKVKSDTQSDNSFPYDNSSSHLKTSLLTILDPASSWLPTCLSLDFPRAPSRPPSLRPVPLPALPHRGCSLLTDSSSWVLCRSSRIFRRSGRQKPTAISIFSSRLIPYS